MASVKGSQSALVVERGGIRNKKKPSTKFPGKRFRTGPTVSSSVSESHDCPYAEVGRGLRVTSGFHHVTTLLLGLMDTLRHWYQLIGSSTI